MSQSAAMAPAGSLVLRVTLAAILAVHALHQLFGFFGGPALGPGGLTASTTYYAALGVGGAFYFVLATGILQLAAAVLIAAGWFARPAAGVQIVVEVLRIAFDSARWGFFLNWALDPTRGHGIEFGTVVLAILTWLVLAGAGDWSIDGAKARSRASLALGRARLRERI
jgi:putative oxidoreductase|nr:MAG: hypothetical protein DIU54_13030 [Acidobacteriota bacterium]